MGVSCALIIEGNLDYRQTYVLVNSSEDFSLPLKAYVPAILASGFLDHRFWAGYLGCGPWLVGQLNPSQQRQNVRFQRLSEGGEGPVDGRSRPNREFQGEPS
jgi:hypothetical protein